jgi:DNA-directed RNA polymerase subunit RPC12/RpoP
MDDNKQNTNQKLIFLGPAIATPQGKYAIKKAAILGYHAYFHCPKCGRPVMFKPLAAGFKTFPCKHCNTQVIVKTVTRDKINPQPKTEQNRIENQNVDNAKKESTQNADSPKIQHANNEAPKRTTERFGGHANKAVEAKIVWGGLLSRKSYCLKEGNNWIGRWDVDEPSDIMVKDDYMSRRSACIEVIRKNGESLFKFTVKRSTNPVKVNGKEIESEQCIYLNYDDSIEMGNTTFFVKKGKSTK